MKNIKFGCLLLFGLASVWLLCITCNLLEGRISRIPLTAMVRGTKGSESLLPLAASLLFCLGSLLAILIITGITTLVRPIGLLAVYALLLPLPLLLSRGKSKEIVVLAGLFGVTLLSHLGSAAKEMRSRIKFSLDSLDKWRSIVSLVLLVLVVISVYHGSVALISNEGPALQAALEEKAAGFIDKHVPELIEGMFSSERVAELSKSLPPEIDLGDLQGEILSHLPSGSLMVEKAREQAPKVIALMRAEFEKTKGAVLKGPLISLQNLGLLGALWTLLGTVALFLGIARVFSAIAGPLTGLVIELLLFTGVITKVREEVTLERLSI